MRKCCHILLCMVCLVACTGNKQGTGVKRPGPCIATPAVHMYNDPQTDNLFTIRMFSVLATAQKGNIVYSPTGTEAMVRLLQQGAAGATLKELNELHLGKENPTSSLQITQANALFVDSELTLKPEHTGNSIHKVPFTGSAALAANAINQWVNKSTSGKISKIIGTADIDRQTRMTVLNAINLKAEWQHAFDKNATKPRLFTTQDGKQIPCQMMISRAKYRYAEGDSWQAVALMYTPKQTGSPACFVGILPKGNARAFATLLTPHQYKDILKALAASKPQDIVVQLPRFEHQPGTVSLTPALKLCGMQQAFGMGADFSRFSDTPLYVADVLQQCRIIADETGTEASAANLAELRVKSIKRTPQPGHITFDRPFIWVITDLTPHSTPYFMGLFETP